MQTERLSCPSCSTTWPYENAHAVNGQCPGCGAWLVAFNPSHFRSTRRETLMLRPYKLNRYGRSVGFEGGRGYGGSTLVNIECPFCGDIHQHGWPDGRSSRGPEYRVAHCNGYDIPHWGWLSRRGSNGGYRIDSVDGQPVATPA